MPSLNPRTRVLLIAAALLAVVAGVVYFVSARYRAVPVSPVAVPPSEGAPPDAPSPGASPSSSPSSADASTHASPSVSSATPAPPPPASAVEPQGTPLPRTPPEAAGPTGSLLIPVAGVKPEQLRDTYNEARSEGRTHNALDIMAPRGTPVLAAADGRVVKLFNSERGGITVYQLSPDEKTVYYYAHLERYADGLREGQFLRRGDTLGYVGDTGNAGAGNYHLHFAVWLVTDPKRYWDGANLNPYPLTLGR